ncbi:MAG: ABC transporter permease, partial [Alistipes sp.]|nr:ABC transporter permease [Alistipes sp.]
MANNISLIVGREFRARVRKKSFIITTLLMPVLMIGLMVAPALIMEYSQGEQKRIAVIDESGLVAPQLQSDEAMAFETVDLAVEEARNSLADHFAILYIGSDILSNPSNVRLYANASTSIMLEEQITSQIKQVIENEKLKAYQIDNLDQILAEVETHVSMQTFRNDKTEE